MPSRQVAHRLRRTGRRVGAVILLALVAAIGVLGLVAGPTHEYALITPPTSRHASARHARARADGSRAQRRHPAETRRIRRLVALGLPIYCGGRRGRDVALTFDDGPGVYTHLALVKLRAARARATFFDVGRSIEHFPGYLRPELRVGTIGDHTESHPELTALSASQVRVQLSAAVAHIRRGTGFRAFLWRPPYELHNATTDRIARRLGLLEILWNVDSQDSLGANYLRIIRNVEQGLRPGAIIEMHENRGQTIRALSTLLPLLRRRHLRAVTVPELLASDPPSIGQLRRGGAGCGVAPGHRRRGRRAE